MAVAALLREKGPLKTILPTKLIIRQSSDPGVLGAVAKEDRRTATPLLGHHRCFGNIEQGLLFLTVSSGVEVAIFPGYFIEIVSAH
jgi:hypothetical protein